ncbi:hypothetical protein BLNAU_6157 [Blattamonas nauphoetae]|uniref:Uncharacterized protein n=1 Tax=Blattamonas nauphoetae TaxID=2049346 RepID=A0ABQ9Y593_9EUKA|nr:hypothetical protein BLNAU_6157 [Blattamonas nauphoetae]
MIISLSLHGTPELKFPSTFLSMSSNHRQTPVLEGMILIFWLKQSALSITSIAGEYPVPPTLSTHVVVTSQNNVFIRMWLGPVSILTFTSTAHSSPITSFSVPSLDDFQVETFIFFNTYFSSCFLSRHHPFTFAPDLLPLTLLVPNTSSSLTTADTFEKFQFNHSDDIRILAANPNLLSLPTVVITVDMILEMLADFLSLSHRSHRVTAALGLRDAVQVGCEFFA